jgi:hypothetical protein
VAEVRAGLLRSASRSARAAVRRPARSWRWPDWAIPCLYLLGAAALTWRMWANPAGTVPTNGGPKVGSDIYLNVWFMRYAATALSHGQLPALVTKAVNAPQGINVMWNTSLLLPSVLLAPVTLLAGPIVSLTVLLTLGFAGSAASLYFVLRRWGVSYPAAGIGGALYGFSPAVLVAAEDHYHLQFAVLPPLIIDAILRLAVGRGRPVLTGIWLGFLVAAQLFIAEELLVDTALAGAVVLAVLAACRPTKVLGRAGAVAIGTAVAAAVALLLSGHALLVQFHGPLAEQGSPWRLSRYGNHLANFVTAPNAVFFHGPQFRRFLGATGQFLVEYYAYLGWPLLGLLAVSTVIFWRDMRVRVAALTFTLLEVLSLGGHPMHVGSWHVPVILLPWHWIRYIPVVSQALPNRLPIIADGAAAATLAFAFDRARRATAGAPAWRRPAIAAAAALALLPIIPRPVPAAVASPAPPGFGAAIAGLHLQRYSSVLVLPAEKGLAMDWQALAGEQFSLVGGYCIAPDPSGKAVQCDTYKVLSHAERTALIRTASTTTGRHGRFGPSTATMAAALSGWRPTAVVTAAGRNSRLGRYLTRFFGPPTIRRDQVLGWRLDGACELPPRLHQVSRRATGPNPLCAGARQQAAGRRIGLRVRAPGGPVGLRGRAPGGPVGLRGRAPGGPVGLRGRAPGGPVGLRLPAPARPGGHHSFAPGPTRDP